MQNWTSDQLKAIEARDKNLIVSAAAGSGKTAVLIERIFNILKEGNTDVTNILMITFTRKAASEMKEKLQNKLDTEILKTLEDQNLSRQRNLLEVSDIKTIDSFCLQVVKNHYDILDLDMKFQIIDDKRNIELKNNVMEILFEELYHEADQRFLNLVETYGKLESDQELRNSIIELYDFSQSNPEPDKWLRESISSYDNDIVKFESSPVGKYFKEVIIEREIFHLTRYLDVECELVGSGADEYQPVYEKDFEILEELKNIIKNQGLAQFLEYKPGYQRLPRVSNDHKNRNHDDFKKIRDDFKKKISDLTLNLEEKLKEQGGVQEDIRYLIEVVLMFGEKLIEEKRKINLFDYNDIEHFSLKILEIPEYNKLYQDFYEYICIDEYQDTNGVQEKIFNLISREDNMFYVGDLKQSIYRFRLADSTIFNNKVSAYTNHHRSQALTLNKNFRSSKSVVNGVNFLFNNLMDGFISPVRYREDAQLVHGSKLENDKKIETYIIDLKSESSEDEDSDKDDYFYRSKIYKEAEICAKKIRHLVDEGFYQYKDFTILANSVRFIIDPFKEIFDAYNIPVYGDIDTGFLKSFSVGFIIDYLEIIDNINNDLALINILKSPIYDFNLEELALIRKDRLKGENINDSLLKYLDDSKGLSSIKEKIKYFIYDINNLKSDINDENLTDFTINLLVKSKYYYMIFRKEDHELESLNIIELLRLISEFEKTNNTHLSGFLKYFKSILKNDISIPISGSISELDDVVKIQTIHKSKGLEYENVFLVKLGDMWKSSASHQINYHQKLGIGIKTYDSNNKTKKRSLNNDIITKALNYENLEDKLNLLYVAMTRAKDNLYLVGSVKNIEKYRSVGFDSSSKARSHYDLILPILFTDADANNNFEVIIENDNIDEERIKTKTDIELTPEDSIAEFKERTTIKVPKKLSATDFVRINNIESALTRDLLRNSLKIKPEFLQEKEISSVEKGIIFHLVMELLDFSHKYKDSDLENAINSLVENGVISEKESDSLDFEGIQGFLNSDIYLRLLKADNFEKEKAFNLMISPKLISSDYDGEENILVQGIIDLYFIEDGKAILIDYKTDHVDRYSYNEKLDEYKKQLKLYKTAIENIKDISVKEAYLYFSRIRDFVKIDFGG